MNETLILDAFIFVLFFQSGVGLLSVENPLLSVLSRHNYTELLIAKKSNYYRVFFLTGPPLNLLSVGR